MHNKKAQASEGVTWIAATLPIIAILIISVLITSFYVSKNKEVEAGFFSPNINQKSFHSWLLTEDSESETVYSKVQANENLDSYSGNLAVKVFKALYEKDYVVWVGIISLDEGAIGSSFNVVENDYFKEKPVSFARGSFPAEIRQESFSLRIPFDERKTLEATFARK